MKWVDQQHPHHLGANQNGPISSPNPYLLNQNLHFLKRFPRGHAWKTLIQAMRQNEETAWGGTAAQSFMDKSGLAQSTAWILSAGREELEVLLKAHVKCFTHTNSGWHIHPVYPLLSKLPAGMFQVWNGSGYQVNWITPKETGLGYQDLLRVAFWLHSRSGLGFLQGLRMTSLYQAFLSLTHVTFLLGGNMYLGTSNILPSY